MSAAKNLPPALETLQELLAGARNLLGSLVDDPQLQRLIEAFRQFPAGDRDAILQVIEKDAAWRQIVERTTGATGIDVRPNPHASLYVHLLEPTPGALDQAGRDANVIRSGLETFVRMLPLLFQPAVRAQWQAAAREITQQGDPEIVDLAVKLAHEVIALVEATRAQRS
jgi:hypothetical protein